MSSKKYRDFEDWDPEYDIPDDPRPSEEEVDERQELVDQIYYKEDMVKEISDLKQEVILLLNKQNNYWDDYGDNYKLEELVKFALRNKEAILGVVKNAKWLEEKKKRNWEEDFFRYYDLLQEFAKRSTFAIGSYNRSIKKMKSKLEEL